MEDKSEDYKKGYLEGIRRVVEDIPKNKWNFRKVIALIFGAFDEYIDGLNEGYSDEYKKIYSKVLAEKYISDQEKDKIRSSIQMQMKKNGINTDFDTQSGNIKKYNNMNSIEYQIDLLEELKQSLLNLKDNIDKVPKIYNTRIEQAKESGLLINFIDFLNERYEESTEMLNELSDQIENDDIVIIENIISDLEELMDI